MERLINAENVAGIKQTKNAIISGDAAVVYLAEDVSGDMLSEIAELCTLHSVEVVSGYSRKEIAKACRIDVPCAAAAVLK